MNSLLLQELITQSSRVILPDFGAFLVKDDGSKTFKAENVSFSPFLRYNDGKLEDWVAGRLAIGKEEAVGQIATLIESIRGALRDTGEYPVGSLGFLLRDAGNSIRFSLHPAAATPTPPAPPEPAASTPTPTPTPAPPRPALTPPAEPKPQAPVAGGEAPAGQAAPPGPTGGAKPAPPRPPVKPPTPRAKPTAPPSKPAVPPAVESPSRHAPPARKGSGTLKAILMGLLIGVVCVIILVGVFIFMGNNPFAPQEDPLPSIADPQLHVAPLPDPPPAQAVDVPEGQFHEEFERMAKPGVAAPADALDPTPRPAPAAPPVAAPTPSARGPYHLIVGSFRNADNAQQFSRSMTESGFSSSVVVQPSGMHAVTVGSYATRAEAQQALRQVRPQHPNVWILRQ